MASWLTGLTFLLALPALGVAALLWGHDSRERYDSPEWERRRAWAERAGGKRAEWSTRH